MAATSIESTRTTRPLRLRLLLASLGICCVVVPLLMLSARLGRPQYRRFTSQPLPDGSRYTFLYPAYLHDIHETGQGASQGVTQNVSVYNRIGNPSVGERLGR